MPPGSRPAPYGTGSHLYLTTGEHSNDGYELHIPTARWLPAPTGDPVRPPQEAARSKVDFRSTRLIGAARC